MKNIYNWNDVDWLMQDIRIAEVLGCSRERVRQRRKELSKMPSPSHHVRCPNATEVEIGNMDTSEMTAYEIYNSLKNNVYAGKNAINYGIKKTLKKLNKPYIKVDKRKITKYDWKKADWTLTDKEVALKLGVNNPGCVTCYRIRHGVRKNAVRSDLQAVH